MIDDKEKEIQKIKDRIWEIEFLISILNPSKRDTDIQDKSEMEIELAGLKETLRDMEANDA